MEKKIFKKLFAEISVVFIITSLTLGLIIWILQAVNFLDIISEDGHSIATYFKYSLLNLPKILSKIFLLSFFLSIFYVLVSYDEKNQLLIYWSNGISKNKFLNNLCIFSILFILFSFLLSFIIVPFTQDKARSFIRTSTLDFFPSLIKPKQFIDTVENLTIFIDEKKDNEIKNIILKDSSNLDNIQVILAKDGEIVNKKNEKLLILNDGKIVNSGRKGKSTIINFNETNFGLNKYKTKTTTFPKIQEINSIDIYKCSLSIFKKEELMKYKNFNCNEKILKDLIQEFYKRTYLPLYIPLISIIVGFLILNSHNDISYSRSKLKIFLLGVFFIMISQVTVSFISENMIINFLIISIAPLMMFFLYFLFKSKMKISS